MTKNPKLNVGLVFDDSLDSNDGVAQYVKTLGSWLNKRGHTVSYLVGETKISEWAGGKVYSLSKNQAVSFNGNRLSIPVPGNGSRIKDLLASRNFDILHIMVPYSPFMASRVIMNARSDTTIVGTFHIFPSGFISRWGSKILKLLLKKSIRRFTEFVSVSSVAAQFAESAYGIQSSIVPNPVDIKYFRTVQHGPVSKNEHRIVFLGRLVKRKGAAQLIQAFALLAKKCPEARLKIAGDGPERKKLMKMVRQLGIADKVEFLGYIKEKDKPELLSNAAVACFPSLYGESFGIVLVEAMAAGAGVVIGGDNPGYRSVLGEQPESLVNPHNKLAFADRLYEVLINNNLKDKLHEWQAGEVRRYDIDIVGAQIEDIYSSAIARLNKKSHNKAHE